MHQTQVREILFLGRYRIDTTFQLMTVTLTKLHIQPQPERRVNNHSVQLFVDVSEDFRKRFSSIFWGGHVQALIDSLEQATPHAEHSESLVFGLRDCTIRDKWDMSLNHYWDSERELTMIPLESDLVKGLHKAAAAHFLVDPWRQELKDNRNWWQRLFFG